MPGITRIDDFYEDEELSQYDTYLARSSIPTRVSVVLTCIAGLLLTGCFLGSTLYISYTGKRIYDPEGNDNTTALLVFLGIGAAMFDIAFIHVLAKYHNTYGTTALLSEAEGQWQEETESVSSIRKPKRFRVVINLLLTFVAVGFFLATVLAILRSATSGVPKHGDDNSEDRYEMLIRLLFTAGFSIFFAVLTKKSYLRYRYNSQFSQEPLVSGVYYGNGSSNNH